MRSDTVLNRESLERDIVVLGASAGGVRTLIQLLEMLPGDLPALLALVIHRGAAPGSLAEVLARASNLPVVEAAEGAPEGERGLYIAPPDRHLVFTADGLRVTNDAKEHSTRPAIDPLFRSAAEIHGPRVVGVVLTGCGSDGTRGLSAIRSGGGISLVQDPDEAEMPYMPEAAIEGDHPAAVLPLRDIAAAIDDLARGRPYRLRAGQ